MATGRVERRLSAILAADIVGYSRLIEADEAGTLAAIRALRQEIVEPTLAEHGGRIVKLMGDGAIVEFASAVDAVACAVAWQESVAAHEAAAPADYRIDYRIGVNLGDVVVEGDDLLGDGVNVAARLESVADPGGICISDTVHRQLVGKTTASFEDLGERVLKNITQPVRVWRWGNAPGPNRETRGLALPDRQSIAVLPFDNLSGNAEETYFTDGITEDILTGLARFRSLFVIARNSSFAFRGQSLTVSEIGRRLGVSYVLEGSVRRAGNRVRISAQLIEAASGAHLWAERYDRDLEDIFAVQDEVARTIVVTLVGRIEDAKLKESLRKPTTSLAAYDYFLRGLVHYRGYRDDDNQKACEMFQRAVELDPRYTLAHAYLARTWTALNGHAAAPPEVLDRAFATAMHALELDPQESGCHRAVAVIWLYRRDFDMAEHHYRRAHELNPNAETMMGLGIHLATRGRLEEALGWIESAMRLNPFHHTWYNSQHGVVLYSLRRYAEAAKELRLAPDLGYWSRARLAACYAQLGRTEDAAAEVKEVLRQRPDFSIAEFMRRDVLLEREADRNHLRDGLIAAGLPE